MLWYSAGTVSISIGANIVNGTNTQFTIGCRLGDAFNGPDGKLYEIVSIIHDTAIVIEPAYLGSEVSNVSYRIVPIEGYVKSSADTLRAITDDLTNRLNVVQGLDAVELAALNGVTSNIQTQLNSKFTGNPSYIADRANHTGTQAISTITDLQDVLDLKQASNGALANTTASFTTTLNTKLAGIAAGATVNQSDYYLLSRANHIGSIAISEITGLQTELENAQPRANVLTATSASFTTALNTKLNNVNVNATVNDTDANLRDRTTHTGVQTISTITGLAAAIAAKQDTLVSGTSIKTINGINLLSGGDIQLEGDIVLNGIQTLNGKSGATVNLVPSDIGAATSTQGNLADTTAALILSDYVTNAALSTAVASRASAAQGIQAITALQPGAIESNGYLKRIRTLALAAI
jgi:putative Mn2+ efflux pump MntP